MVQKSCTLVEVGSFYFLFYRELCIPRWYITKNVRCLNGGTWTLKGYFRVLEVGFPLHKPYTYSLYRWGFLHFRYLKCLASAGFFHFHTSCPRASIYSPAFHFFTQVLRHNFSTGKDKGGRPKQKHLWLVVGFYFCLVWYFPPTFNHEIRHQ